MNTKQLKSISKRLSFILRHRPDSVGLTLEPGGWVSATALLAALSNNGTFVTPATLEEVVSDNDKQRFEFSADRSQIRARQGHSAEVDLQYEAAIPPDLLFHGTATRFLESIFAQGLIKGNRHHVHLSINHETMIQVGKRHGQPTVLEIDAKQMVIDGHQFLVTGNAVWLTDHVPPQYLKQSV